MAGGGWKVHVVYCGPTTNPDGIAKASGLLNEIGVELTVLEEVGPDATTSIPQFGDCPWGLRLGLRVMNTLRTLQKSHHFDLIEFADWQGVGFRTVQAKRRGLAFSSTDILIKLHAPHRWERNANGIWIEQLDDHKVDYCERYTFENCDTQLSPSRYIAQWATDEGWSVREDVIVSQPYPTDDFVCHNLPINELVFFGRLELRKGLDLFLEALDGPGTRQLNVTFMGTDTQLPNGKMASDTIRSRMGSRPHRIESRFDREEALRYLCEGGRLAVIPSRAETFGYTLAECIVHLIPFVACEAGGNTEAFYEPEARQSWLVPATVDDLKIGITRAIDTANSETGLQLRLKVQAQCASALREVEVLGGYGEALRRAKERRSQPPRRARFLPMVSIAVTHFNLGNELACLLPTLRNQSYPTIEVLIVDDGSTDEASRDSFSDLRREFGDFHFLEQSNAGPGAARNRLLDMCAGEFFIPVDADNLALEHMVEQFVDSMLAPDEPDISTCFFLAFRTDADAAAGIFEYQYAPTGGPFVLSLAENVFGDTNAAFRTETLRKSGGFETNHKTAWEDWETFVRLVSEGAHLDVIPEALFLYRKRLLSRSERLGGAERFLFPLQKRLLREFFMNSELDPETRLRLWESTIGYRMLEGRSGRELSFKNGEIETLRNELARLVDAAHSKPLGYRVADWSDLALRRYPAVKGALRGGILKAESLYMRFRR